MAKTIEAVYEDGGFRPIDPDKDAPEMLRIIEDEFEKV